MAREPKNNKYPLLKYRGVPSKFLLSKKPWNCPWTNMKKKISLTNRNLFHRAVKNFQRIYVLYAWTHCKSNKQHHDFWLMTRGEPKLREAFKISQLLDLKHFPQSLRSKVSYTSDSNSIISSLWELSTPHKYLNPEVIVPTLASRIILLF